MYKKIILASAVLAATVGVASAAAPAPYVGASIGITNNTLTQSGTTLGAYRGVPFSLFAGYGGVVSDSFYIAGELNGTVGTANISDNSGLKTSYGLGLSVLPGLMVNDNTLAYARLGIVRSHFSSFQSSDENRNGAQFGLGLQTTVTQNLDVRGEYDYIAYKSINAGGLSFGPRSDQFTVGLVYKIS